MAENDGGKCAHRERKYVWKCVCVCVCVSQLWSVQLNIVNIICLWIAMFSFIKHTRYKLSWDHLFCLSPFY